MFFTPKWKKEAILVLKGSKKFIHYKRDLLSTDDLERISDAQKALKEAISSKDKSEAKKKCNLLDQACRKSLSSYVRPSFIAENTEAIFVAVVICLGLRAYYTQPFTIPTNSMQPTLNGINSTKIAESDWPSLPKRMLEIVTHGRSYVSLKTNIDDTIIDFYEYKTLKFFTLTKITFESKRTQTAWGSVSALKDLGLRKGSFPAGSTICEGIIDAGDTVLVDKFSYHFRKPTRGETFVFDTRDIKEILTVTMEETSPSGKTLRRTFPAQTPGDHYIKRCVGVPGDTISIDHSGHILVNGKIATDPGLLYAMDLDFKRAGKGYTLAGRQSQSVNGGFQEVIHENLLDSPSAQLKLKGDEYIHMAEYAAFGDNTEYSSDSRYWGTVKEFNLVGPALFSLWPFSHQAQPHWGFIK